MVYRHVSPDLHPQSYLCSSSQLPPHRVHSRPSHSQTASRLRGSHSDFCASVTGSHSYNPAVSRASVGRLSRPAGGCARSHWQPRILRLLRFSLVAVSRSQRHAHGFVSRSCFNLRGWPCLGITHDASAWALRAGSSEPSSLPVHCVINDAQRLCLVNKSSAAAHLTSARTHSHLRHRTSMQRCRTFSSTTAAGTGVLFGSPLDSCGLPGVSC